MSTQATTNKSRRRKFWFLPRFSMRTFFVVSILIGAVLGPFVHRTRQQMLICSALGRQGVDFKQSDPPYWTTFLPDSWLKIADRQWYLTIDSVELNVHRSPPISSMSRDEQVEYLNEHVKLLAKLSRLKKLEIRGIDGEIDESKLGPMLRSLAGISGLEEITFGNYPALDFDVILANMPSLPRLLKLSLPVYGKLTNQGLEEIKKFPRLEELTFYSVDANDECLKTLASLKFIRKIIARNSRFSVAGLECFFSHPALEVLECATPCTDEILKVFGSCPNMRTIYASESLVTDNGLAHLKNLKKLDSMFLWDTCISDKGLAYLSDCKELKLVWCKGCKLTDAIGATLSQLPKLESVDLRHTFVTQDLLPQLRGLSQLEEFIALDLPLDTKHAIDFATDHPGLQDTSDIAWSKIALCLGGRGYLNPYDQEKLILPNIQGISGHLGDLREIKQVRYDVNLRGTDIKDDDLQTLSLACDFQRIDLGGTAITPNGLSVLAREPLLHELRVGPFEDADEAMKVISTFPALVKLEFVGGDRLSEDGKKLLLKLNKLEALTLQDCCYDDALTRNLAKHSSLQAVKWLDKNCGREPYEKETEPPSWLDYSPKSLLHEYYDEFDLGQEKVSTKEELHALNPATVRNLNASGVQVSSEDIAAIANMPGLQTLNLSGTNINNEILKQLGSMSGLEQLDLSDNPISDFEDQSVTNLMQRLNLLNLAGTKVTDAAVSKIIWSTNLWHIDLSRTSVTEKAWELTPPKNFSRITTLSLEGVTAAPRIIKGFANYSKDLWPTQIETRQRFGLNEIVLSALFGQAPARSLNALSLTPEILQAWSIQELLKDKMYLDCLSIVETQRVSEIVNTAKSECPFLRQVVFVGEHLEAEELAQLPSSVREVYFKNCSLSSAAIEAIADHELIRRVYFDDCNLDDCSLQPLASMKFLASVVVKKQKFSPDHLTSLRQLKPSLVEWVGW